MCRDVTTPLNNGMGRFMQTLRLATAATSVERMVWLGEPSMIHVQPQEAWPQVEDIGGTWWRRVVTLTPDHLPGLRRLAAMVDRLEFPAAAKKKKGAWLSPRSRYGWTPTATSIAGLSENG